MYNIYIDSFNTWREKSRILLRSNIPPSQIQWLDAAAQQHSLFEDNILTDSAHEPRLIKVGRDFMQIAETVACHRSFDKWSLLYEALWRIQQGESHLLHVSSDLITRKLQLMYKAVRRDAHKMKAFVRFRYYKNNGENWYIAWYQPDHLVINIVAPFFQQRFNTICWAILTPDGIVAWNGESLAIDETKKIPKLELNDEIETMWLTYYRAIFNPARIKLKAMYKEMPRRYWQTLPETKIIPSLLAEAPQRVEQMLKYTEGFSQMAADFIPKNLTNIDDLRQAAKTCRACSLHQCAKQIVWGSGNIQPKIMLVGEQPGDQEDNTGLPFQGPAGKLLYEILNEAKIDPKIIYFTNAVKHFKHRVIEHRRIHVTPNVREINACNPWLKAEIALLNPSIIVCLGLTAARALVNANFRLKDQRGKWIQYSSHQRLLVTYHPSAVLRAIGTEKKQEIYNALLADLTICFNILM